MSINEYYSRLFDIIYEFYGDVNEIEIIVEHGALNDVQGVGKKMQLRFIPIDIGDKVQEYFTFIVSSQMSDLCMIEQTMIHANNATINLPTPIDFIHFLLNNTSLLQLNVKTIK